MIEFREVNNSDPALAHSPMVHAIEMTFSYIAKNEAIGLTSSKAFKRTFIGPERRNGEICKERYVKERGDDRRVAEPGRPRLGLDPVSGSQVGR